MSKGKITFSEFIEIHEKLEIKVGQIVIAERIPKKDKLLKLTVVFGETESDVKTVVTNLGGKFEPEAFLGLTFPFVMNLEPSKIGGIESEAMIMVFHNEFEDVFLDGMIAPRMGSILL